MFTQLIVPVDLSAASFDAVGVAARMATGVDARVTVMSVTDRLADVAHARDRLVAGVARLGPLGIALELAVDADRAPASAIARRVEASPGAMTLMRSHGHGRSAAVVGSTTDELLRAMVGPIVVIGPRACRSDGCLTGPYVVPVDGSSRADGVLAIVAAWATDFGATPWLVSVVDRHFSRVDDVIDSSAVVGSAHALAHRTHADVEFEVLHDRSSARAIVDFAARQGASLIFLATHGRTGIERLRTGSMAAGVVRQAHCPVVLFRPVTVPRNPWMRPDSLAGV